MTVREALQHALAFQEAEEVEEAGGVAVLDVDSDALVGGDDAVLKDGLVVGAGLGHLFGRKRIGMCSRHKIC